MKLLAIFFILFISVACTAQTSVKIDNQGTQVDGYFYATKKDGVHKAPTIVALHGCGGMLNPRGKPNFRSNAYAKILNRQGWHVLFIDSLSSRHVKSICTDGRLVTQAQRVSDVQAAVAYLSKQSDSVDAQRIGILGWSHGGSTALLSNDAGVDYLVEPRAIVAFYPGCLDTKGRRIELKPIRPVLMQLGEIDDWTNPIPCQTLAAQWPNKVRQDTYAQASHGFDSDGPVRAINLKLPRENRTVHTGGDPLAKATSQAKMISFFKEHFK
jgi:dienelactone hydrolase